MKKVVRMKNTVQRDIKRARARLRKILSINPKVDKDRAYDLAIKAYLRGYYEGLHNVETNFK